VLVARVTDRIGKGVRGAPRDALIADETTPANRGRAFGFHRAADTTGAVIGPLLALLAYDLLDEDLRPLMWLAVVPAVLSTALVFLVRERPHPRAHGAAPPLRPSTLPRLTRRLVAVLGLFALVNFPDAMLLLRADDLGLGVSGVICVYVLYNLTYAALSYPAGVLSDRIDRRHVFGAGLVVFAVTYLGFGLVQRPAAVWALLPVYGAYTALTDGVSRAWVADVAPPELRGTALGVQGLLAGVGLMVAGIWAGLAWGAGGRVPFLLAGTVAAVLAVGLLSPLGGRVTGPAEQAGGDTASTDAATPDAERP
jgi:MFS family permease